MDLGRLSCNQVFKLKDREGFWIRLSLTKTVRKGAPREFVLVPFRDLDVCPIFWLDYYIPECRALEVQLSEDYTPILGGVGGVAISWSRF